MAERMDFPQDFRRFVAPGVERLVALAGMLAARGLSYQVLKSEKARHLAVRIGKDAPRIILMAHYDRVKGSPGVLDNSCACLQLADFACRAFSGGAVDLSLLIVFTDAEEAPGSGSAANQGALALARAIRTTFSGGNQEPPSVLVFDVTGRGDRLLLSSAPARLLARGGLSSSSSASCHEALNRLARLAARNAGLFDPLSIGLPWSDDLGLVLGGLGALTVSLLPKAEVDTLVLGGVPATWKFLHTKEDRAEVAEAGAFSLMGRFLDALIPSLLEPGCPFPGKRP